MAAERVTAEDLRWAAMWMLSYNDGDEIDPRTGELDEQFATARRVAAWMDREADRREIDSEVHALLKAAGVTNANPSQRAKARRIVAARRETRETTF